MRPRRDIQSSVPDEAKSDIAVAAEEAANADGVMIMVDMKAPYIARGLATDSADTILRRDHRLKLLRRNTKLGPTVIGRRRLPVFGVQAILHIAARLALLSRPPKPAHKLTGRTGLATKGADLVTRIVKTRKRWRLDGCAIIRMHGEPPIRRAVLPAADDGAGACLCSVYHSEAA